MERKNECVGMVLLVFALLAFAAGCATTPVINNDLVGTWYCRLATGEDMEIGYGNFHNNGKRLYYKDKWRG
jgi:hypothetical protein